jgi:SARP family transcriptional regulator, regulator of embCAB operon
VESRRLTGVDLAERWPDPAAIQSAELVLGLDELRESGWRILMRAHAAAGNVGSALRAFERCRLTLHEQLGTVPSPSTRAAHSELLR